MPKKKTEAAPKKAVKKVAAPKASKKVAKRDNEELKTIAEIESKLLKKAKANGKDKGYYVFTGKYYYYKEPIYKKVKVKN